MNPYAYLSVSGCVCKTHTHMVVVKYVFDTGGGTYQNGPYSGHGRGAIARWLTELGATPDSHEWMALPWFDHTTRENDVRAFVDARLRDAPSGAAVRMHLHTASVHVHWFSSREGAVYVVRFDDMLSPSEWRALDARLDVERRLRLSQLTDLPPELALMASGYVTSP